MSPRRNPGRGTPQATWKDPRRRPELAKAIGAGAAVVLLTALIIFLIQPGDTTPAIQTPIQTPVQSVPTGVTDSTVSSLPPVTTPSDTTDTTVPAGSSTTPTQP
jgi:hypothetical protein